MKSMFSRKGMPKVATAAALLASAPAQAEWGINFPPPVTPIGQSIYDVHMITMQISTVLMFIAFAFIGYSIYKHRKSKGFVADQNFHKSWFGSWSWVLVPAMVLGVDLTIAGSAQKTLEQFWESPRTECSQPGADPEFCFDMQLKVIGHQWWWEYEFPDIGVEYKGQFYPLKVESRAVEEDKAGSDYLREVDHPLILPVDTTMRILNTSVDVNHAWWVPELGFKRDAIAGYIMETWAKIDADKQGTYRGQCAELCGTWHAKMPVVVKAVSKDEFNVWVEKEKAVMLASLEEQFAVKTWTMEEMMLKGEDAYNNKCAACHQVNGTGLGAAFPALKGSKIALGAAKDHILMVLNGKGTMPSWKQLSDLEIAAIVTYERNAWGNNVGDVVQPGDVAALR
jgi:cytochrome c oxidase subunit 2